MKVLYYTLNIQKNSEKIKRTVRLKCLFLKLFLKFEKYLYIYICNDLNTTLEVKQDEI